MIIMERVFSPRDVYLEDYGSLDAGLVYNYQRVLRIKLSLDKTG